MKKLLFAGIASFALFTSDAQLKIPAPSPTQTLRQDFGLASIEVVYSRPGVKGRKVFGDLVPYGKVWRTGANSATTISFGDEVMIGGKKVPAGKYGLVTIPDKKEWTIIITKQLDLTSPDAYKPDMDVARVTVEAMKAPGDVESFTMMFENVKPSSCELRMSWERTEVVMPITTEIDSKVMKQIDQLIIKDGRQYFQAAMYYMDNGKDLNQALLWFDKAVENQPNAFFIHHQRANCLAKMGKKDEAKAAAEKSRAQAVEQKNDDYVRLNDKLLAELNK